MLNFPIRIFCLSFFPSFDYTIFKIRETLTLQYSQKNKSLVQKLDHISRRTTREKLISYLSAEARRQNSASITIPYNRQQLADFLSVDRSAMSNELCKMRDEGLIVFKKNRFQLL
ncbi:MAG: winged helix-turn-helix domain-containing protein [Clostridiales bacterium]|nr:winged helix-turn-helix domain-containing protein [Clostridiales bacterium]